MTLPKTRLVVATLLLVVAAPDAEAKGSRVRMGGGSTATSGPVDLALPQLRVCLALENSVNTEAARLEAQNARLDIEAAKLKALQADVSGKRSQVDNSNEASVNSFNAQLAAAKKRTSAHMANVARYNADGEAVNRQAAKFRSDCGGKSYLQSDYAIAKAEVDSAAKAQAKAAPAKPK